MVKAMGPTELPLGEVGTAAGCGGLRTSWFRCYLYRKKTRTENKGSNECMQLRGSCSSVADGGSGGMRKSSTGSGKIDGWKKQAAGLEVRCFPLR